MVKHTQIIHRLLLTNCLSVFDHFVGLPLKWLKDNGRNIKSYLVKHHNEKGHPCTKIFGNTFNPITPGVHKMVKHKLKILQQMLLDF